MKFLDRTTSRTFFAGLEIEATRFFLLPTLFAEEQYDAVVLDQKAKELGVQHVFLIFSKTPSRNIDLDTERAFSCLNDLVARGYKVTFEIRPDQITDEFVALAPDPSPLIGQNFSLLIGNYFPDVSKLAPYTTLKLFGKFWDEKSGIFCMKAEKFIEGSIQTPWDAYKADDVIDP